jgi:hypothetical protein
MSTKTTIVLRDLNAERPEGLRYGLVILYDGSHNSETAQEQAESAYVGWYATKAELDAAWEVALDMDGYLIESAAIKRLDELATVQYALVVDVEEGEDAEEVAPYIAWAPQAEWAERLAVGRV